MDQEKLSEDLHGPELTAMITEAVKTHVNLQRIILDNAIKRRSLVPESEFDAIDREYFHATMWNDANLLNCIEVIVREKTLGFDGACKLLKHGQQDDSACRKLRDAFYSMTAQPYEN